jgi:hypothetical protein
VTLSYGHGETNSEESPTQDQAARGVTNAPLPRGLVALGPNQTAHYNMLSFSYGFLKPAPAQSFQKSG